MASTTRPRSRTGPRSAIAALLLGAVLLVAACGDDGGTETVSPGDGASTTTTTGGTDMTEPTDPTSEDGDDTGTTTPTPTGQSEAAVADLAERLGVEPADVTLVSVEAVTWRDSSIGCPQRDMAYLQVLTEGVRIVLEVDGTRYRYHAGGGREPFYCATPQDPLSVG